MASGMTHKSGIAIRSVVKCDVVDNISPDGTAASAIQYNRRRQLMCSVGSAGSALVNRLPDACHTFSAQIATNAINSR